jgi:hypothetical protein
MSGPQYTTLQGLVSAIAANAGINAASAPQADFTFLGAIEAGKREVPRITWTPLRAKWEPAEQDEEDTSKQCNQRRLVCEITFVSTDFDAANKLVSDFGAALFRTQTRHSGRVLDEDHARQAVASSGRYQIVLTVEIDLPVTFETYEAADVEATAQAGDVTEIT